MRISIQLADMQIFTKGLLLIINGFMRILFNSSGNPLVSV